MKNINTQKILKKSILIITPFVLFACANDVEKNDEVSKEDIENASPLAKKISSDINIPLGSKKDLDGDGVMDVMLTVEGKFIDLGNDDKVESDDNGLEVDEEKTYSLEYDEEDDKYEIDVENEFEQAYEEAGKGVKNAVKDVGQAVGDVFDGKDNDKK